MVIFTNIAILAPYPSYWTGQGSFEYIFGFAPRIVLGGYCAYLVGQFTNAKVMVKIKEWFGEDKPLFIRTIGSTLIGEAFDCIIFCSIVYIGFLPNEVIIPFIILQYIVKVIWEILMQPVTYKAIAWARKN